MTEDNASTPESPETENIEGASKRSRRCRRSRRRRRAGVAFLAIAALFVAVGTASAGFWRHHHNWTEDEAREHAGEMSEHILDRLDGTDDQQKEVDSLIDELFPELWASRTRGRELKKELHDALAAEKVDPEAIEEIRAAMLAEMEKGSKEVARGVVRLSEILTPEQRGELMEKLGKRMHHHE